MGFDALVLRALSGEMNRRLAGGRVQRVYQPAGNLIVLQFTGRGQWLTVSAHPSLFHVSCQPVENIDNRPPGSFGLLLRRHLEGLKLTAATQPSLERLLSLTFEGSEHDLVRKRVSMHIELIPRATNIVLTDHENLILGAQRVTSETSGPARESVAREVSQGLRYEPPEARTGADPFTCDPSYLGTAILLAPGDAAIASLLVKHLAGISPPVAREIVHRAGFPVDAKREALEDVAPLYRALATLMSEVERADWHPGIAFFPDDKSELSAVALSHAARFVPYPTMDEAIASYYRDRVMAEALGEARSRLLHQVKNLHARAVRKEAAQAEELASADDAAQHRRVGDAILAAMGTISRGAASAEVMDFETGEAMRVNLDPRLSPAENAQVYFKRYQKAKRTKLAAEEQLKRTADEVSYLAQALLSLEQAESPAEVEAVQEELQNEGVLKARGKRSKQVDSRWYQPRRYLTSDGLEVLVGRNSRENERLSLHAGVPYDIWLHAKDIPGAHVILRMPYAGEPPEESLSEAASIAAYHSRAREAARVPIDYTLRKHVWKAPGNRLGLVNYDHQQTISVPPALPGERLDAGRA